MNETNLVDRLIDLWQSLWEAGDEPVLDAFFDEHDCPEHLRSQVEEAVQLLKEFDGMGDMLRNTASEPYLPTLPVQLSSRFDHLEYLDEGGLGVVSRAIDPHLGCEVAIKSVRDPSNSEGMKRLRREAEITARLTHPGIVPIHGIGQDADGRPCYVMKLVHGKSLATAIGQFHGLMETSDGKTVYRLRDLLERFCLICNAAGYIHSQNVIHRDLKPDNVMLGDFGETLIIDCGLAKELDALPASQSGAKSDAKSEPDDLGPLTRGAIGSPGYWSPEQKQGDPLIGPQTDIYSLGAILDEILTARRVTEYEIVKCEDADQRARLQQSLQKAKRCVPKPLNAICQKAMAEQSEDRYDGADELAADVKAWLVDEPVAAYRDSLIEKSMRWMRKHRAWTFAGIASLVLAVAFSLILYDYSRELEQSNESGRIDKAEINKLEEVVRNQTEVAQEKTADSQKLKEESSRLEQSNKKLMRKEAETREALEFAAATNSELQRMTFAFDSLIAIGSEAGFREESLLVEMRLMLDEFGSSMRVPVIKRFEKFRVNPDAMKTKDLPTLGRAMVALGMMSALEGDLDKSATELELALILYDEYLSRTDHVDGDHQRVAILSHLGQVQLRLGNEESALVLLESACKCVDELCETNPGDIALRLRSVSTNHARGNIFMQQELHEEAADAYRAAVDSVCKAAELGDKRAQLILAGYHSRGLVVPHDLNQMIYWTGKSGEQDREFATKSLSFIKYIHTTERLLVIAEQLTEEHRASAESENVISPTMEGLRNTFQTMLDRAENGDLDEAKAMAREFVLPEHESWFNEVFGEENGVLLATDYSERVDELVQFFEIEFENLTERSKDGIIVFRILKPRDHEATGGQRKVMLAMRKPVALYSVKLGGLHIWSFVYVDGKFRLAGKMYRVLP